MFLLTSPRSTDRPIASCLSQTHTQIRSLPPLRYVLLSPESMDELFALLANASSSPTSTLNFPESRHRLISSTPKM